MGNSNTNNSIHYTTKDGYNISYLYWDLKGKNRFPDPPGQSQVNFMLDRCLQDINASQEQIKQIQDFNNKYKYRFVVLHKRKLGQAKKQKQLEHFKRKSTEIHLSNIHENNQQKHKINELQLLMKDIQLNETVIKVALMKIDRFIAERYAHLEFIKIKGFQRLIQLLNKAVKLNATGTKTNFSNQIQLLKFLKIFSDRYPKQFFNHIIKIKDYAASIIRAYHPINTHITAYCLSLLTDYIWRIEQGQDIIKILQKYRVQQNFQSFLSPFAQSISETDSIIMVYYNLKFINELMAAVIQQDKKQILKENLSFVKYNFILDNVKLKLEQGHYIIDNSTFISMHQKIFKYATKQKSSKKMNISFLQQTKNNPIRTTFNMNELQQIILRSFIDIQTQPNNQQSQKQENNIQDEMIVAYIGQSDRKRFNKFILDTITEIQKYSKLQYYLQGSNNNIYIQNENPKILSNKIDMQNLQSYIARIKQSCIKNSCSQNLIACFKNLQYFEKNQWKNLQRFILQQLALQKKIIEQVQTLKNIIEQKQIIIKRILKENNQLKHKLFGGQYEIKNISDQQKSIKSIQNSNNFKKKQLNISLPLPPNKNIKNDQLQSSLIGQIMTNKNQKPMRDKPKLIIDKIKQNQVIIEKGEIKFHLSNNLNQKSHLNAFSLINNLPAPPSLNNINLPTPPLLNNIGNLPPPPSLGSLNLPPPPPLNNNLNLPPPPSLGSLNLPPPPPLNNNLNLPPPPPLNNNLNLPPPPSLGSLNLPPPPPLNNNLNLPPPPPLMGITSNSSTGSLNLPPPPPLASSNNLPPPPIPQMNTNMNTNLPNLPVFGLPFQQPVSTIKTKQKCKPKIPLKACNYTVLTYDKIKNTIFQEIDDTKIIINSEQIQQLFPKNIVTQNKQKDQMISKSSIGVLQVPKVKQKVKLIGSDRWRNIQIVLTKLKIPSGEMYKSLTSCTGKYVSHSVLQSVAKILPNQQQEQMIKSYQGNQQDLGMPEKFMKQIIQVKQYSNRVKAMIFSNIKQEFYYQLSFKFQQLKKGFESLRNNNRLKHVIQICLALGNYLNGTSLKGGAWGFKIQTIQRIQQVKSADNKINAAFYLIRQVWKKYPYPIFDKDELQLYQYISKMPISQLSQELGQLNLYDKAIKKAFSSQDMKNSSDNIGAYCEQMTMELSHKIQQYKTQNEQLKTLFIDCAQFYCQDGAKTPSDEFGKKMFQCILFISNTQKMFKVIEDKRSKQQTRKAIKNQIVYQNIQNVNNINTQTIKDNYKSIRSPSEIIIPIEKKNEPIKVPQKIKLPIPPQITINKQQKLKQIQKMQLQRQKKALEQVMMKRTSKLQAYRMSKMSQTNKKHIEPEIDFLKSIK